MKIRILGAVAVAVVSIVVACVQGGGEGDRCNPLASHDECGDGLSCVTPGACPESYCCPSDPASSTSSFCRADPDVCPAEAGADAAVDASPDGPADAAAD